MRTRPKYRRSDLFLVRLWSDEAGDVSATRDWHGKVQRAVDGEAYQFDSWQDLLELLESMVVRSRYHRTTGSLEHGKQAPSNEIQQRDS